MNDLSPETNQLLEMARGADGLSDERRSQLKAGLLTQIAAIGLIGATSAGAGATVVAGAGVAASAGAGAVGAGSAAGKVAWLSSSLLKAVSALTLISVTGAGVYAVAHSQRASEPAHSAPAAALKVSAAPGAPPAGAAPVTPDEAAPVLPTVPPADAVLEKSASAPTRALAVAPLAAPVTPETLAEETRLLRDADQALRAGNAQRALALLDEHATRYPRGALAPERSAERMIARCQLGQVEAKSAQAYLSTHANSAFATRIRDACRVPSR